MAAMRKATRWRLTKTPDAGFEGGGPSFAEATEDRPSFAEATEDRPSFAEATEDRLPSMRKSIAKRPRPGSSYIRKRLHSVHESDPK